MSTDIHSSSCKGAEDAPEIACVLGAGSIGVAFAVVLARAGFRVRMWDAYPEALDRAQLEFAEKLEMLFIAGGNGIAAMRALVSWHVKLEDAVSGAALIQECVPEQLGLKQELFERVSSVARVDAVLASSTSALKSSDIAEGSRAKERMLVAHPANPPFLLPVIEIVPSTYTSQQYLDRATDLYTRAGLRPVLIRREVEGFVFNRLQGALLREAYCLVRDGVASVADIDDIVRLGLGRRWSVIGPFETVDLNTRGGIESHAVKMGPAYERMGAERGQHDPWTPDLVADVVRQRRALLDIDQWESRVRWRDEQLLRFFAEDPGNGEV